MQNEIKFGSSLEMTRAAKLFQYFIYGTIFRRLYFEKIKKRATKKEREWKIFYESAQNDIVIELAGGALLRLYKDSNLSPHLFKGNFEFNEIKFIQTFLKKGDVFIDIGANIGYFSVVASRRVGENGIVHSFEPTDETYTRLLGSMQINNAKNIIAHSIALSNRNEEREFTVSTTGFDAYNSLGTPSEGNGTSKKKIFTRTLDSLLPEFKTKDPSLVKIDVEGWEIPVLEGMKELLTKQTAPVLLVEFTDDNARASGYTCTALFDLIISLGFNLYKFDWVNNTLIRQDRQEFYTYTNLIAVKNGSPYFKRLKSYFIE